MSGSRRAALQPAFLLHHRDFRDSSRIVELLTRERGRISLFAHGVKRAKSPLRALLQPFVPLLVSWSGGTDDARHPQRITSPSTEPYFRRKRNRPLVSLSLVK